jgi:hypothetical protein
LIVQSIRAGAYVEPGYHIKKRREYGNDFKIGKTTRKIFRSGRKNAAGR